MSPDTSSCVSNALDVLRAPCSVRWMDGWICVKTVVFCVHWNVLFHSDFVFFSVYTVLTLCYLFKRMHGKWAPVCVFFFFFFLFLSTMYNKCFDSNYLNVLSASPKSHSTSNKAGKYMKWFCLVFTLVRIHNLLTRKMHNQNEHETHEMQNNGSIPIHYSLTHCDAVCTLVKCLWTVWSVCLRLSLSVFVFKAFRVQFCRPYFLF